MMKKIKLYLFYIFGTFGFIYELFKYGPLGLIEKTRKSLEGIAEKDAEKDDLKSYYKTNQHINGLKKIESILKARRGEQ